MRIKRRAGKRPNMMKLVEQANYEGFVKGQITEQARHTDDEARIQELEGQVLQLKGCLKMVGQVVRNYDDGKKPSSQSVQTALFYSTVFTGELREEDETKIMRKAGEVRYDETG